MCSRDPDPPDEGEDELVSRFRSGLSITTNTVCLRHTPPWQAFREYRRDRPPLALIVGPRGGGKSFLSALDTHLTSLRNPRHETRILGGSKSQSEQILRALRKLVWDHADVPDNPKLLRDRAAYPNGSEVEILAASATSVRGPHVASLKLDEVDEIDPDLRDAAMGMCMNQNGMAASVLMTSTWHRQDGPISELMDRSRNGVFPMHTFCAFEVLERCPESRSGPNLERCGECPLMTWCHQEVDQTPSRLPKAKLSSGHYSIDALIQKVRGTSRRTFESDYLCMAPRAHGIWFEAFDEARHVSNRGEYDPHLPVHVAIDTGCYTGAVFFQVAPGNLGEPEEIHVFGELLTQYEPAEMVGKKIIEVSNERCHGERQFVSADPAGNYGNGTGLTILGEFQRAGLEKIQPWPTGLVADGLALVESFLQPADGIARLLIHPRCEKLIDAFRHYKRAKRDGQYLDRPQDPQHPAEDMLDALRGGLKNVYPQGRYLGRTSSLPRIRASRVF
ncbi:MAG: hypothetical protein U0800_00035 [Isosphaeraceae bacterium]